MARGSSVSCATVKLPEDVAPEEDLFRERGDDRRYDDRGERQVRIEPRDEREPETHRKRGEEREGECPADGRGESHLPERPWAAPLRDGDPEHAEQHLRCVRQGLKKVVRQQSGETERTRKEDLVRGGPDHEEGKGDETVKAAQVFHDPTSMLPTLSIDWTDVIPTVRPTNLSSCHPNRYSYRRPRGAVNCLVSDCAPDV